MTKYSVRTINDTPTKSLPITIVFQINGLGINEGGGLDDYSKLTNGVSNKGSCKINGYFKRLFGTVEETS